MNVGPFRLVDPPAGQAEVIAAAVAAINYPWYRLDTTLATDPDRAVLVRWVDTGMQASGYFYGGVHEIHLSRDVPVDPAFVFAHEVGHLIDAATLDSADRAALLALMHTGPPMTLGHYDHDHPDAGHRSEQWDGDNDYTARPFEAFADLFVAAFAPSIWQGHWPRFVHWTTDFAEVRRTTLRRDLTPPPVRPAPAPASLTPGAYTVGAYLPRRTA